MHGITMAFIKTSLLLLAICAFGTQAHVGDFIVNLLYRVSFINGYGFGWFWRTLSSSGSNDIPEGIDYGRQNVGWEESFPQLRSAIVQLLQAFEHVQLFAFTCWMTASDSANEDSICYTYSWCEWKRILTIMIGVLAFVFAFFTFISPSSVTTPDDSFCCSAGLARRCLCFFFLLSPKFPSFPRGAFPLLRTPLLMAQKRHIPLTDLSRIFNTLKNIHNSYSWSTDNESWYCKSYQEAIKNRFQPHFQYRCSAFLTSSLFFNKSTECFESTVLKTVIQTKCPREAQWSCVAIHCKTQWFLRSVDQNSTKKHHNDS